MNAAVALDAGPFERAVASLAAGLERASATPADDLLRDGAIQRFEYTWELSWKLLKRHLETVMPDPAEVDSMSFRDLIRTGCERGLLRSGVEAWSEFRRARAVTSHVYDRERAMEIFAAIPAFLVEARFLLARLREEGWT